MQPLGQLCAAIGGGLAPGAIVAWLFLEFLGSAARQKGVCLAGCNPTMKPSAALRHTTGASAAISHEALEAFFSACQAELLGLLYFQTGSIETAREAFQQCFAECWRNCGSVSEAGGLRAWVFAEALRMGRRYAAPSGPGRALGSPAVDDNGQLGRGVSAEQGSEEGQKISALRQWLKDLDPEQREVFLLRENGQLSYEEIAQVLGVPLETIKAQMRAALERLRVAAGEEP